jgi:hypothetical protein
MQAGTITIKPLQADLLHNTEGFLSKMDPYLVFALGNQRVKTATCKNGGKTPFWHDVVTLTKSIGDDTLFIEVWDDETIKKDKYNANCQIPLTSLTQIGHISQWIDLFFENQPAGKLLLDISFQSIGGGYGGQTMSQQYQQSIPQQQFQQNIPQQQYQQPINQGYQQTTQTFQKTVPTSQPLNYVQQQIPQTQYQGTGSQYQQQPGTFQGGQYPGQFQQKPY